MFRRITVVRFGLLLIVVAIVALALVLGKSPGAVLWSEQRVVAFESDDWGFCGFVPDTTALTGLDRGALATGYFPPVYWESTLEDSSQVAGLCDLLSAFRGSDGLPPVFQANYIVSALAWEPIEDSPGTATEGDHRWVQYDIPRLPPRYGRPGMWNAVADGMAAGLWRPEFHGAYHYEPAARHAAALTSEPTRVATGRGVTVFAGSERAYELGRTRPRDLLVEEFAFAREVFTGLFGRPPVSIIAPDYVWDACHEDIWQADGVRVIQAKREQRFADGRNASLGRRVLKIWLRTWARLTRPGLTYLERNCRLEPVQHDDHAAVVEHCRRQVHDAWRRNEPAIVETHRINFAHCRDEVARAGRQALSSLCAAITAQSDRLPLFLSDDELAGLQRRGTSWTVRGGAVVARNLTESRKVLTIPHTAFAEAARNRGEVGGESSGANRSPGDRLVFLPAASTRILY